MTLKLVTYSIKTKNKNKIKYNQEGTRYIDDDDNDKHEGIKIET